MREVSHINPLVSLPTPIHDLPWARRERADTNIRRAISELRALAVEDIPFTEAYEAMADAFESSLALLDVIEGSVDAG